MPSKRKHRVVLDSVVLVSAFLTEGLASELLDICGKEATLYTAEEILQEIRRVLLEKEYIRNRYQYSYADVEIFVSRVRERSVIVRQIPDLRVIERDPGDDMVIACAVAAEADYIVSRDLDLLDMKTYQGIQIISPENFIHFLRSNIS